MAIAPDESGTNRISIGDHLRWRVPDRKPSRPTAGAWLEDLAGPGQPVAVLPAWWMRALPMIERSLWTSGLMARSIPMVEGAVSGATTLRLVYPQWQGAGAQNVAELLPELPVAEARRGYAMGSRILNAILPTHDGPTEIVPVGLGTQGLETEDGVEARRAILDSLAAAQEAIGRHSWERMLVLGGECAVSVAPFSALANRYGDDLAVVWLDSHPDVGTPDSDYHGFHAMALAALTGHGDPDIVGMLPATVDPAHVALAGLHVASDEERQKIESWNMAVFPPDELRETARSLTDWLAQTGCSRVAIHFDVDSIDSDEVALGLGKEPGGLSAAQARQVVMALSDVADVVGLTVAEFIPRDALAIVTILRGLPLVDE